MTDFDDFDKTEYVKQETNWTSFDLYYQGFHVKKSIPENVDLETIKKTIDRAKDLGFEPSWNQDTNAKQDPIMKATRNYPDKSACQHPEDSLEEATSKSEKNPGRKYMKCGLCKSWVRWA